MLCLSSILHKGGRGVYTNGLLLSSCTKVTTSLPVSKQTIGRTSLFGLPISQSYSCSAPHPTGKSTTPYTLNDAAPVTDRSHLVQTVTKHWKTLDTYLSHRPIAQHTQDAFDDWYQSLLLQLQQNGNTTTPLIVLDSGCGTGRSTLHLGKLYDNNTSCTNTVSSIVGVDRSLARLERNSFYRSSSDNQDLRQEHPQSSSGTSASGNTQFVSLVQAELVDFWRLLIQHNIHVRDHYLLYPNPYPKKRMLNSRLYGHPAFALLFRMKQNNAIESTTTTSTTITVRSNWKQYLEDFYQASLVIEELSKGEDEVVIQYDGEAPVKERDPQTEPAWTNFEQKYDNVGEKTYELKLLLTSP